MDKKEPILKLKDGEITDVTKEYIYTFYCNHCGARLPDDHRIFLRLMLSKNYISDPNNIPDEAYGNFIETDVPLCKSCAKKVFLAYVPVNIKNAVNWRNATSWDECFDADFPDVKYLYDVEGEIIDSDED